MTRMEQWDDFQYEEADRRARGVKAMLEQAQNVLLLEGAARVWDATGSTSADRIRLDQRTGDFTATGHVNSSRLPDQKKSGSEMLSGDEPLAGGGGAHDGDEPQPPGPLRRQGGAVAGRQPHRGGPRGYRPREADPHRGGQRADRSFWKKPSDRRRQQAPGPRFHRGSGRATWSTPKRTGWPTTPAARYGGPGLRVKAAEIRAFLARAGRRIARGKGLCGRAGGNYAERGRAARAAATGEHAEYYTGEQKIILRGGAPQLVDSLRGNTQRRRN